VIDALIRWSLQNKLIVLSLAAILLAWGGWQALALPVDVLPDLTAPTVTILVEGGGIAPEEMEALVTFPLEAALNGAAGVRRVRSVTAVGAAIVWVEFEWGEDIHRAQAPLRPRRVPGDDDRGSRAAVPGPALARSTRRLRRDAR
jgi:Cu/Ag efflux pump CusA